MTMEELLAALEANAQSLTKPVSLLLPGIGTIYVRKRTVKEFEEMAAVRAADRDKADGDDKGVGLFGPSLARLLCDETGKRFPPDQELRLATALSKQPEEIFHAIVEAADGQSQKAAKPEEQSPGN